MVNGVTNGLLSKTQSVRKGRKGKRKSSRQSSSVTSHADDSQPLPAASAGSEAPPSDALVEQTLDETDASTGDAAAISIVIDNEDLDKILEEIVQVTAGSAVDLLENLYWILFRTISKHVRGHDRSLLPQVSSALSPSRAPHSNIVSPLPASRLFCQQLRSDISCFQQVLEKKEREKESLRSPDAEEEAETSQFS